MGKGFKHGSGSIEMLNVYIRAYASEAALKEDLPKNNTIGIVTSTAMTSWCMSHMEPSNPISGMVWIKTGISGKAILNVVRKGQIMVTPQAAYQYINKTWKKIEAQIYQNGWIEWIEDIVFLFKSGDQFLDVTGGWSGIPTESEYLDMYGTSSGEGWYLITKPQKPIDLSEYSKLIAKIETLVGKLNIILADQNDEEVAEAETTGVGEVLLNLSNVNYPCYIVIVAYPYDGVSLDAGFEISEVRLER